MGTGTEFSDPAWWQTAPPKPPKKIPTAAIVFGTFVPVAAIVIGIVAVMGHKHSSSAETGRSLAAFQACMKDQGATTTAERSNSRFLDQDAQACRSHLPRGMAVPSFAPPTGADAEAQRAFAECMQAATANISRGFRRGPFGGGSGRQAFESAIETCRSLVGQQSRRTPPPPATTTAPAVA